MNNRLKWRDAIENGNYDPQSNEFPSRTPSPQKKMEVDGDVMRENDIDDDDDDNTLLVVKDLSRALVQIGKCVESKYLGPPLGKRFSHEKFTHYSNAITCTQLRFSFTLC